METLLQKKTFNDDTYEFAYTNPYVLRGDINVLQRSFENLDKNVDDLKNNITKIQNDISSINQNVALNMKNISDIKDDMRELRDWKTEVMLLIQKQDSRIDAMEKRFDDMNQSQNKWFTVFGLLFALAPLVAVLLQNLITK